VRTFIGSAVARAIARPPGGFFESEVSVEQQTTQTVHFYDTEEHRILCGIPGHTSASKHAGTVTCRECLRILREREMAAGAAVPTERN